MAFCSSGTLSGWYLGRSFGCEFQEVDVALKQNHFITWRGRGLSKQVISRVIRTLNEVTPTITLLINDLLSPLPLQVVEPFQKMERSLFQESRSLKTYSPPKDPLPVFTRRWLSLTSSRFYSLSASTKMSVLGVWVQGLQGLGFRVQGLQGFRGLVLGSIGFGFRDFNLGSYGGFSIGVSLSQLGHILHFYGYLKPLRNNKH